MGLTPSDVVPQFWLREQTLNLHLIELFGTVVGQMSPTPPAAAAPSPRKTGIRTTFQVG